MKVFVLLRGGGRAKTTWPPSVNLRPGNLGTPPWPPPTSEPLKAVLAPDLRLRMLGGGQEGMLGGGQEGLRRGAKRQDVWRGWEVLRRWSERGLEGSVSTFSKSEMSQMWNKSLISCYPFWVVSWLVIGQYWTFTPFRTSPLPCCIWDSKKQSVSELPVHLRSANKSA